ncbi:MAG: DsbA family protein [Pseudomonadales bacterium]|nr:DsbA family protein [Pseudomonadales bacterium]
MNLARRFRSTMMGVIASPSLLRTRRARARLARRLRGDAPAIHYFHQVDDPYSHLAVQKIDEIRAAYRVAVRPHLVGPPLPEFQGDTARFAAWALRDASSVAPWYGVGSPGDVLPEAAAVRHANAVLSSVLDCDTFATRAIEIGTSLWHSGANLSPDAPVDRVLAEGNRLRTRLGHYLGAMFYFEGEWFWGLDRLHLLERRLIDEGYAVQVDATPVVPMPQFERVRHSGDSVGVTLEYFPSLRSPYTAVGHGRVADLVQRSGVTLKLRPVIPMMMRGIPAPRNKQLYIMMDAAREARYYGVPFGRFVDPFGEPVLNAFSYFPAASEQGLGMAFVGSYLAAAFGEGIDISSAKGLGEIMDRAGLVAADLRSDREASRALLDDNLSAMMDAGLWGVPSFRVSDETGEPAFACWGQDRIWRVEAEIARRQSRGTDGRNEQG